MKYILVALILGFGFFSNAQEVERNGKKYVVKKDKIFHDGNDVTATFSIEEQMKIKEDFSLLEAKMKLKEKEEKRLKNIEKERKQLEKDKKRAESKQKKAEKELKKKIKMQANFEKASKNYEQAQSKYQRLKERGKLSPVDEAKWLKKIETLNEKVKKAENRLKRS
jgi:hypothetical protein